MAIFLNPSRQVQGLCHILIYIRWWPSHYIYFPVNYLLIQPSRLFSLLLIVSLNNHTEYSPNIYGWESHCMTCQPLCTWRLSHLAHHRVSFLFPRQGNQCLVLWTVVSLGFPYGHHFLNSKVAKIMHHRQKQKGVIFPSQIRTTTRKTRTIRYTPLPKERQYKMCNM
jgi:hypothetical protein